MVNLEQNGNFLTYQWNIAIEHPYSADSFSPEPSQLNAINPVNNTNGSITLVWNASVNADNYTVYRSLVEITVVNDSVNSIITTINTNYTDTVSLDGTYYYAIIATNATGSSVLSNCESVEVDLPIPNAPILNVIVPNPNTTGDVSLSWSLVSGVQGYFVYRNTIFISETGDQSILADVSNGVFYQDNSLANGTYYYVVVAHNYNGNSLPSNCVNITVAIAPALNENNTLTNSKTPISPSGSSSISGYSLLFLTGLGVFALFLNFVQMRKKYTHIQSFYKYKFQRTG